MEIKRVFHVNMVKRKDVMHKYNGIFLNHKKEQNNTICSNVDVSCSVVSSSLQPHVPEPTRLL